MDLAKARAEINHCLSHLPDSYFLSVKITDEDIVQACKDAEASIKTLVSSTPVSQEISTAQRTMMRCLSYINQGRVDLACSWGRAACVSAGLHLSALEERERDRDREKSRDPQGKETDGKTLA